MKGKWKLFWFAMGLAVVSGAICVVFPFVTQQITDKILVGQYVPDGSRIRRMDLLGGLIAVMVGAQLLRSAVKATINYTLEYVSQNVLQQIRHHLYETLCGQDARFYARSRAGDLMTRLTGDLDMVRHTVAWISFSVIESISLFVFSVCYLFSVNVRLTAVLLLVAPCIMACTYAFSRTVFPKYVVLREKLSHMNSVSQENIEGNKTVRAFVREEYEKEKFEHCNDEFRSANLKANFHWLKFYPWVEGCIQSMTILTILVGGCMILDGELTAGGLAAFSMMNWGLSEPMRALGIYLNDIQRFLTSASKVMELYYSHAGITSPENGAKTGVEEGVVEFRDVSFSYVKGKEVLRNISFRVEKGSTVAIMGPTGSGKTTLVDLMTRMQDAVQGQVLVDGLDVKKWDLQELRRRIGVATQKVVLYSDTVSANIAYGKVHMPAEEVARYAHLAAADFAAHLPEGYDTVIGEQGTGLSGGQKQRIALARALAKQPEILVLDDTTSAVDMETEQQLRQNLANLPFDCTKIMVAQRISAVREADCILILENGQITQCGTHRELSAVKGYYREICELQGVQDLVPLPAESGE